MYAASPVDRRTFIADLGHGAFALAVVGLPDGGHTEHGTPTLSTRFAATRGGTDPGLGQRKPGGPNSAAPTSPPGPPPGPPPDSAARIVPPGSPPGSAAAGLAWHRVNLGFVSAYVLVRGGEAAIVDTGVAGSADAIGDALRAAGFDWSAVAHLILTHNHRDHAGSAAAVMERATGAKGYAGAEDIAAIRVPRPLTAVADGARVFDLQIVTAPGHTAGSICAFDSAVGVLVAGDALRTDRGKPLGPNPSYSADMDLARRSVAKLARLGFETLLVGHGGPLEGGASAAVAELAARL